jgi:hypothetical protein
MRGRTSGRQQGGPVHSHLHRGRTDLQRGDDSQGAEREVQRAERRSYLRIAIGYVADKATGGLVAPSGPERSCIPGQPAPDSSGNPLDRPVVRAVPGGAGREEPPADAWGKRRFPRMRFMSPLLYCYTREPLRRILGHRPGTDSPQVLVLGVPSGGESWGSGSRVLKKTAVD